MVDMERIFTLVVFNYIYSNGDANLKKFSLIIDGLDYRLTTAYDLLNTSLHVDMVQTLDLTEASQWTLRKAMSMTTPATLADSTSKDSSPESDWSANEPTKSLTAL